MGEISILYLNAIVKGERFRQFQQDAASFVDGQRRPARAEAVEAGAHLPLEAETAAH
jgi:hypothetical protein